MNRLRELRRAKKITLNQLKNILKENYGITVSDSQLMYYENNKRKPRNEKVWTSLAHFYGVTVAYLLNHELYDMPKRSIYEEVYSALLRVKAENPSHVDRVAIREVCMELIEATLEGY